MLKPEVLAEPYKYKRVIADYGLDNVPRENWPTHDFGVRDGIYYQLPTQTL